MDSFEALYRATAPRVYAYARRHVGADLAEDVVAETFAVAWRRRDRVPDDALPWLLVTARNLISNHRRTAARADRLWFDAVRELWHRPVAADPQDVVAARSLALHALAACTRPEREALLLVAWDGLKPAQAAAVAGCSTRAFTVRLSRARKRFTRALEAQDCSAEPERTGLGLTALAPTTSMEIR